MQFLVEEFLHKIEELQIDSKLQEKLQVYIEEILQRCLDHLQTRSAVILLNEEFEVVGCNALLSTWFGIGCEQIYKKSFFKIMCNDASLLKVYLEDLKKNGFLVKKSFTFQIGEGSYTTDLIGERVVIDNRSYYLLSFSQIDFNYVEAKLDEVERDIDNLILRIKDFNSLVKEVLRIFIDSDLFHAGWVGKIDRSIGVVIPLVVEGDEKLQEKIEGHKFPYAAFEHIVEALILRKDIYSTECDLQEYEEELVFPIFEQWNYENSNEIAFLINLYTKDRLILSPAHLKKLREILYKINLAITEIHLKHRTNIIALSDPLTGLMTREGFMSQMDEILQEKIPCALVIVDVDKLRKVNQLIGFWAGDLVLQNIAFFLKDTLKEEVIARIGSDEFGLIIKGDKKRVYSQLDKILSFNDTTVVISGEELYISLSIGVAFYPDDGKKKEELVFLAENALLQAKKMGGKRIEFANKNITFLPKDYLRLERELKEAIEKDEYFLLYQPIIDLHSKTVWGVEALVRWKSKSRGIVPPGKFIPILEESGLINEVGELIIEKVCKAVKEFEEVDLKFVFSFNLSVTQLISKNVAQEIIEKVKQFSIKSENLIVEITETVLMENIENIRHQIDELTKAGIRIEIDDFGTGYSSLSYLKRLPISALKIDRSFIMDMHSQEGVSIVTAIVSMAKALGMKTIAEGVEEKESLEKLQNLGVDYIQGFYFAKPMPQEVLREYIKNFDLARYGLS